MCDDKTKNVCFHACAMMKQGTNHIKWTCKHVQLFCFEVCSPVPQIDAQIMSSFSNHWSIFASQMCHDSTKSFSMSALDIPKKWQEDVTHEKTDQMFLVEQLFLTAFDEWSPSLHCGSIQLDSWRNQLNTKTILSLIWLTHLWVHDMVHTMICHQWQCCQWDSWNTWNIVKHCNPLCCFLTSCLTIHLGHWDFCHPVANKGGLRGWEDCCSSHLSWTRWGRKRMHQDHLCCWRKKDKDMWWHIEQTSGGGRFGTNLWRMSKNDQWNHAIVVMHCHASKWKESSEWWRK